MSEVLVAVAQSEREEEAIERVLDDASIAYSISLDAGDALDGSVCYLGRSYRVAADDVERARRVLLGSGMRLAT